MKTIISRIKSVLILAMSELGYDDQAESIKTITESLPDDMNMIIKTIHASLKTTHLMVDRDNATLQILSKAIELAYEKEVECQERKENKK